MLVLTAALVMAAIMVAMAMPAFAVANENADPDGTFRSTTTCYGGQMQASLYIKDDEQGTKHYHKMFGCLR